MQTASLEAPLSLARYRSALWLAVPCLVLLVLHVLFALSRDRPLIFADEAGYIGNARFLAGGLPIKMLKSGSYYPGYSLILAPVFWLGFGPQQTYQAILVVNGLLLCTTFVSLVYWIRRILGDGSRYGYAIAFAASAYPTFFVQPGFAMSESAVIALTAVLPLVLYALVEEQRALWAALFGLGTAFLYSIHPRFIGSVGTVLLGLGALAVLRIVRLRLALLGAGTLAAGVFATKALSRFVAAANEGGSPDSGERIQAIFTPSGMWSLTLEVLGQFWYLEVGTAGLVLIGVVAMFQLLFRRDPAGLRRHSPAWIALLFTLLTTGLAFGVSCGFMSEPHRVDHFIYGRYNEGVLAPVLATGIWAIVVLGKSWRRHAAYLGVVAAGLLGMAIVLHWARGSAWSEHANLANILALIPYMKLVSGLKLMAISLVALGGYALFTLASRWRPWLGLSLLSAGFLVGSVFAQRSFLSMQRGRATRQVLFDRVASMQGVDKISYDESYFDPVTLFFGQYFLPNTEFEFFESSRGQQPKSDYVLGHEKWANAAAMSSQLIGRDKWGYSLWSAKGCCTSGDLSFTSFGAKTVPGTTETGFYATEVWPMGPVRWTNGDAHLTIPVDAAALATSSLYVDVASLGPGNNRVEISANGKELFKGKLGKGRSRLVLPLAEVDTEGKLELAIGSKTFVPAEQSDTKDTRQLGVAIASIRIVRECCLREHNPFGSAE